MTRYRSASEAAEEWMIANDPDGPRVVPVRARCNWPVIGGWFHVWGRWEPIGSGMMYQRRTCAACGLREDRLI